MTKLVRWAAQSTLAALIALSLVSLATGCAPQAPAEDPDAAPAQGAPVAMYMTEWCPVCRQARKWLEERGYVFVEHDVERDPRAAVFFVAVNPRGSVPTFDVGGEILIGFDPERLRAAITESAGGASVSQHPAVDRDAELRQPARALPRPSSRSPGGVARR